MKDYKSKAEAFIQTMPYKEAPFSGRNWGHKWHSLCSYHGKLKPAIAYYLVKEFTVPGDVVLDPLCGVGTIPFEAALQGRLGVGNDLSELAYCVTKAKLERPEIEDVQNAIEELSCYISKMKDGIDLCHIPYGDFGLNHTLNEYFHPETFREIVCARNYYVGKIDKLSAAEAMVFTALLHVLHGNRPYALSRTSHPLTPYAPRGEYIYKNVIDHIQSKIQLAYQCDDFDHYLKGRAIWSDCNTLQGIEANAIITSPPFANSMKFYTQNWMRLWLCGWEPEDFKSAGERFLDQKQNTDLDVYYDFFKMCETNLVDNGIAILHLGKTEKINMAEELSKRATKYFDVVLIGDESVASLEKHGIKDKGGTTAHQYLFLQKK